jgi:malonate decarboxylase epsilon subunit
MLRELPDSPAVAVVVAESRSCLTNTRGRAVTTADAILDDLAQSVAHPVQWYDATRLLPELGATCAIETQPGHVLAHLCTVNAPGITALSLQDNGLAAVVSRARQLDRRHC